VRILVGLDLLLGSPNWVNGGPELLQRLDQAFRVNKGVARRNQHQLPILQFAIDNVFHVPSLNSDRHLCSDIHHASRRAFVASTVMPVTADLM
jgi:hypothetical protein